MKLTVTIEQEAADRWRASCPELPKVEARGRTREIAERRLRALCVRLIGTAVEPSEEAVEMLYPDAERDSRAAGANGRERWLTPPLLFGVLIVGGFLALLLYLFVACASTDFGKRFFRF